MSTKKASSGYLYTPGRGLPIGLPVAPGEEEVSTQVRNEFSRFGEPNTSLVSSPSVAARAVSPRVGALALDRISKRLSERDAEVLRLVDQHRFLSTHQVQDFCFTEHETPQSAARSARRVLLRLKALGLLRPLDRQIGGVEAGSRAMIWRLSSAGHRLVRSDQRRRNSGQPSDRFLDHHLAVADVHVALLKHQRIETIEDVQVEVEPASWRRYQGIGGEARWLQPDLYAEIVTSDFVDRFFIEVDMGSESLPTLVRKCQQYEQYRRSGVEQEERGGFPLVLWFFTDPSRAAELAARVRRSSTLTTPMYDFATPETLTQVLAGGAS